MDIFDFDVCEGLRSEGLELFDGVIVELASVIGILIKEPRPDYFGIRGGSGDGHDQQYNKLCLIRV